MQFNFAITAKNSGGGTVHYINNSQGERMKENIYSLRDTFEHKSHAEAKIKELSPRYKGLREWKVEAVRI